MKTIYLHNSWVSAIWHEPFKQQAITWNYCDQDACHHMEPLGHTKYWNLYESILPKIKQNKNIFLE